MPRPRSEQSITAEQLYYEGYNYKEIAEKLGVPDSTVRRWKSTQKWNERKRAKKKKKNGAPYGNKNAIGNNGGAPIGNTNAVKHGGYSSVFWDTLSEDEKQLIDKLEFDGEELLKSEIALLTIRERRIMKSISEHKQSKGGQVISHVSRSEKKRDFSSEEERALYEKLNCQHIESGEKLPGNEYHLTTTTEATYNIIQRLEEALTRCQAQKQKCIDSLNKLRTECKTTDEQVIQEDVVIYVPDDGLNNQGEI